MIVKIGQGVRENGSRQIKKNEDGYCGFSEIAVMTQRGETLLRLRLNPLWSRSLQ
ncbi:MAG: hypothetical protein JNK37_19835 [Verrucomicrobiales bacterium]|nr:hypothetical protein [Verrucomicrobiales bacterium]